MGTDDSGGDRQELLRTVEALSRRWYPSGVPRELFRRALMEALEAGALGEQHEQEDLVNAGEPPPIRAVFEVPAPLEGDDESFLRRAVTQGLRWRWGEVAVVVRDTAKPLANEALSQLPVIRCGVDGRLNGSAGDFSERTQKRRDADQEHSARDQFVIATVSIGEARSSSEAKRQFWSDIKRLL